MAEATEDWTHDPKRYSGMNAGGGGETSTYATDATPTPPTEEESVAEPMPMDVAVRYFKDQLPERLANSKKVFLGAQTDSEEVPDRIVIIDNEVTGGTSRIEFRTGMVRDTSVDKTRYDLLWPEDCPEGALMLDRWAELLTRGAKHYASRNWELASTKEEMDRFKESAARHFFKWMNNIEDGDDNAAAVLFNIQGYEYTKARLNGG